MARVYGIDKDEIQPITVEMKIKDEEGDSLTWENALEIYPAFANFCEKYPDVARAAKLLLDRRKSGGTHAGGLVISNKKIDEFVPLEVRRPNKKDNPECSIPQSKPIRYNH